VVEGKTHENHAHFTKSSPLHVALPLLFQPALKLIQPPRRTAS
jgi:hypothetical protein